MTSAAYDVLGIGNAIVDVLSRADDAFLSKHGLVKGSMMLIDEQRAETLYAAMGPGVEVSGGSCGNTMAGVASFGGRGAYIGKVRDDQLGQVFGHDLKSIGVSFDTQSATSGPSTARCLILVTPDAQRTMNTYLGACTGLGPNDIDTKVVGSAQVTYVEGYLWDAPEAKKAVLKAFDAAHAAGRQVSITLSDSFCVNRYREEFRDLVRNKVDILFGNEAEIKSLYEVETFEEALEATRKEAKIAALTRSEKGSIVIKGSETYAVPAAPVGKVVDTTGAGDLYASGFLFGLTQGKPLAECARLGGIAAAEVIIPCRRAARAGAARSDLSLAQSVQSTWGRWLKAAEVYRDRRQLIILLMGFASGMPFLLTGATLTYWMSRTDVDLTTIGLFALVGTPYAFKFAWAPLVDQMPLPLLDRWLGRRRSWMLLAQVGILAVGRAAGLERSRPHAVVHRRRRGARRLLLGHAGHRRRRLSHRDPARRGAGRGLGDDAARLPHRAVDRRRHVAAAAEPAAVAGRAQPDRAADRDRHGDGALRRGAQGRAAGDRLDRRPGSSRRWSVRSPSSSPIAAGSSSCCSRCSTNTAMRWAAPWRGRSSTRWASPGRRSSA